MTLDALDGFNYLVGPSSAGASVVFLAANDAADKALMDISPDDNKVVASASSSDESVVQIESDEGNYSSGRHYSCFLVRGLKKGSGIVTMTDIYGNTYSNTVNVVYADWGVWGEGVEVMHRLYNPNTGERFYTADAAEKVNLVKVGWNYEGIGWTASVTSGTPVYRMYNSNPSPKTGSGEHHYTTSSTERDSLIAAGWTYEGIGWYSDDGESAPLYRLYNPNEFNNNHHYTTSASERDYLLSLGWRDEGIAWYGV